MHDRHHHRMSEYEKRSLFWLRLIARYLHTLVLAAKPKKRVPKSWKATWGSESPEEK